MSMEDIEQIKRVKYRYCRCIDTANIAELKELFTEDASICYVGGSYKFEAEGRDNICAAIGAAFHAEAIAFHHVNHPEIDLVSPTEARSSVVQAPISTSSSIITLPV